MTGLEEAFALGTPTQAAVAAAPRVASLALLARVEGGAGVLGQVARSPPPQRSGAAGAAVALCGVVCLAAVGKAARRRRSKVAAAAGTPGDKLSLFSPAKVNLFLRIIRRREDGYHDLASLFHTVSFGDTLDLEVLPEEAAKDELQCNLPGVPVDDSNLVIRALNLFRKMSGEKNYFRINLQKSIPAQAGMGGGSSNAATAFYGANALCGRPASAEELIKWADDPVIGSDATFFLSEGTAYCTGRGEIVTPVAPLSVPADLPVFLVKPRMGLSTPRVFKALDLSMLSKVEPEVLLKTFQEKGADHEAWVNDLEQPAFDVEPDLGRLKAFLEKDGGFGFRSVLMSGSGSTIYAIGEPKGGAEAFEKATRAGFDIEGIWRCGLVRRSGSESWYSFPEVKS
mmetsp:Transcript_52488/g.170476  ORF Transcript_52488/g.170476 Transcript_52488/m.170476 type:complete len:398 (-) Transcript_52488:235-1428(-)